MQHNIQFKNIKLVIFEENETIDNYLVSEICNSINDGGGINLSCEIRPEFFSLFEKLKQEYKNEKISFEHSTFFAASELIYNTSNWKFHEKSSFFKKLDKEFFKDVDFKKENINRLVTAKNFYDLFCDNFAVYDSKIDKESGIDLLIAKVNHDGSLLLNEKIDIRNLNTKGVKLSDETISKLDISYLHNSQMPKYGATLGVDQILKTKKIILVANGSDKSKVLVKLFFSKFFDKLTPLCLMKSHPEVHILSDLNAAREIMKYISFKSKNEIEQEQINGDEVIENFEKINDGNYDFEAPTYDEQPNVVMSDYVNQPENMKYQEEFNPEYETYFDDNNGDLVHYWTYDDGEHQIIYQEADVVSYLNEDNQVAYTNPDRIIYRNGDEEMVFYDVPNEVLYDRETNQLMYKHNNDEKPNSYKWNFSKYYQENPNKNPNQSVKLVHNYDNHQIINNEYQQNNYQQQNNDLYLDNQYDYQQEYNQQALEYDNYSNNQEYNDGINYDNNFKQH